MQRKKGVISFFAVIATVLGMLVTTAHWALAQTLLTRHVREAAINGQAQPSGRLPATQSMRLVLVLPLRHQPELENFLRELYDPSSPSYRRFLTVEEFTERFGPSQEDYDAVIGFAETNGFAVAGTSRNRMIVQVTATVANIERAFHLIMGVYQHPTERRTFFAPDREPTVDLPFPLWHISGLDSYSIPQPLIRNRYSRAKPEFRDGSCPDSNYCGSDMRAAYYGGTTLDGSGQSIGLAEFYGTNLDDLNSYYENVGQTLKVPITLFSVDETPTSCNYPSCDDSQQTAEMTQALGMAPGLSSLVMYIGSAETLDDVGIFNAMATANPLNAQLSCAWNWTPADPQTLDPIFQEFAAQGQTMFAAAGSAGDWQTAPEVYPADDAYVVSVGGTNLGTQGPGGPWDGESAWGGLAVGPGGGISPNNIPIPSWQVATAAGCSDCSQTYRNGPDVAAESYDDFFVCSDQSGCSVSWSGTAFASSMWVGYMALVNQQSVANGYGVLGFVNPALYTIGMGSNYTAAFHDITSGSNGYSATPDYDLATGWGSPNGVGLINALSKGFFVSANPPHLNIAPGSSGTSTITVVQLGSFTGSVSLSASDLPSGVTAEFVPNPTTTTSTLTLTVGVGAHVGTYTITITGVSGSLTNQTTITLTVTASGPIVSLSPTSLTFPKTVVGGTSKPKTVTLTNTGVSTLNITGIATTGDFAVQSTTCGSTLAAKATCKVSLSFLPKQLGKRSKFAPERESHSFPENFAMSGKHSSAILRHP